MGPNRASRGQVRIIGGRWRRRLLPVTRVVGLRPTPDRVRETLFNWLAGHLDGARCLDLFAGTGALGFEAASRGAATVVMVEQDGRAVRALSEAAAELRADTVRVVRASAARFLAANRQRFDIVFLDPPFDLGLAEPTAAALAGGPHLGPGSLVYVEAPAALAAVPGNWKLERSRRIAGVDAHLYAVGSIDFAPAGE